MNEKVFITGASSGIGAALAIELMITIFPDDYSFIIGTKGIIELVTPRILVEKT